MDPNLSIRRRQARFVQALRETATQIELTITLCRDGFGRFDDGSGSHSRILNIDAAASDLHAMLARYREHCERLSHGGGPVGDRPDNPNRSLTVSG